MNKQLMARNTHALFSGLVKLWGAPPRGGIGLTLTEVYYSTNPWVTVSFIASRVPSTSPDTIRRKLDGMVDKGLVEFIESGGAKLYRATHKAAEATIALIQDAMATAPDNGLVLIQRLPVEDAA